LRATIHTIAVNQQEVLAKGIPDKSFSAKANKYLRIRSDQELGYYTDQGISKERTEFKLKLLIKDLKKGLITPSGAYLLLTDQLSSDELTAFTDQLANEIDFLCGEDDQVIELWTALDSLND
jgi:hypothetical protein